MQSLHLASERRAGTASAGVPRRVSRGVPSGLAVLGDLIGVAEFVDPGGGHVAQDGVAADAMPLGVFGEHVVELGEAGSVGPDGHGLAQPSHVHVFEVREHAVGGEQAEEDAEDVADEFRGEIGEGESRDDEVVRGFGLEFLDGEVVDFDPPGVGFEIGVVFEAAIEDVDEGLVEFDHVEVIAGLEQLENAAGDGTGPRANFENAGGAGVPFEGAGERPRQEAAAGADGSGGLDGPSALLQEFDVLFNQALHGRGGTSTSGLRVSGRQVPTE